MSELEELYKKKKEYNNFKYNVKNFIEYLNSAIEALRISKEFISSSFTINDEPADNKKIHNIRDNLINEKKFLEYTVLPKIYSTISDIENKIASLET